jgi:arabinofuranosyltransferase
MIVPIAPSWPRMVRWYAETFDSTQSWLIRHHVCMRHQEHKVFWQAQVNENIPRDQGLQISREGDPLLAAWSVGVPGWAMPNVHIIDGLGLNDHVIARTPAPGSAARTMAHSRRPPEGYIESYQPNVEVRQGEVVIGKRLLPFTRESIAANERHWRERLRVGEQSQLAGGEGATR